MINQSQKDMLRTMRHRDDNGKQLKQNTQSMQNTNSKKPNQFSNLMNYNN